MKVCHIVYGYFPFDPRVHREVRALQASGHEIDVIAMRAPGESLDETLSGVAVHRVPFPIVRGGKLRYAFQYGVFCLAAMARLASLSMERHFDLIHVHSLPDFLVFVAAVQRASGSRIVLDLHEAFPEIVEARLALGRHSLPVRIARAIEWVSCAFSDRVIVVNDQIRKLISERTTAGSKLVVVMNSTPPRPVSEPELQHLREELGWEGARSIIYVGGINEERDLPLLIRAVAKVRVSHPVRLAIFGPGDPDYLQSLVALARRLGFTEDFLVGPYLPQDAVPVHIALSELGPITYERNPLTELAIPNKVFEYALARRPLVIARLGAIRSLFGDSALYYEPGDEEDLASQIARLLTDPELGHELSEKALHVVEGCRWDIMAERLRRTYSDLSDRGK